MIQKGNYIYLSGAKSISNHAGLIILNISNPGSPIIEDTWSSSSYNSGCEIVQIQDNYAFLGAMQHGLITLEISNPSDIQFVSQYRPNPNWPEQAGLFSTPNARGLQIRDNLAFLCYDAGGLRLIDISDKEDPSEVSKYVNLDLASVAGRAYNNIVLNGNFAYVAVDYCGIEVLDISMEDTIIGVDWINPWDCNGASWFTSNGHTNQLSLNDEKLLFVSGGDSEILIYDISNPGNIELAGFDTTLADSIVAWGLSINNNHIVANLIDNSVFVQPYHANYGGIKIYHWENLNTGIKDEFSYLNFEISPNPGSGHTTIKLTSPVYHSFDIVLFNQVGQQVLFMADKTFVRGQNSIQIDIGNLPSGIYFCGLFSENTASVRPLIIRNN